MHISQETDGLMRYKLCMYNIVYTRHKTAMTTYKHWDSLPETRSVNGKYTKFGSSSKNGVYMNIDFILFDKIFLVSTLNF